MTKSHVLASFRRAGFPLLRARRRGRYEYHSSFVHVVFEERDPNIGVCFARRPYEEFGSVAAALRCIKGRASMQVVAGNDWALPSPRRGQLSLVA